MTTLPLITDFLQIVLIDIAMSGDNAIVLGMAAAGLHPSQRHKAVVYGIVAATVLRIVFAIFAVQLLHITGLLAAGGLLLLWVGWKMVRDVHHRHKNPGAQTQVDMPVAKKLSGVILQIVVADVSMSLDNVLAVAGVARDDIIMLVAGLGLSVLLMGLASALVARLTARYAWIGYVGVAIVVYTAGTMIWDGAQPFLN